MSGCVANTPHVDLSVSAFKALFALDIGLVDGVEARVIDDPNGASYDKKTVRWACSIVLTVQISLFGPRVL